MADNSAIEWTHLPGFKSATWNPIAGCTPVSPGCTHCYAATMARRLEAMGQVKYAGTAERRGKVDVFTGRINFDEEALTIPLRAKKPTCYFVNSMSDLFHESVPDEFIDRVFQIMERCSQHVFQVLTKRAERMAKYIGWRWGPREDGQGNRIPSRNIWLGVSAEDQQRFDERVIHILRMPAAVTFVSAEPLLGPINMARRVLCGRCNSLISPGHPVLGSDDETEGSHWHGIDWVIVGGESGHGARPCDVAWIRSIVQQCKAADVACFVKQLGAHPMDNGCQPAGGWWPDQKSGGPGELVDGRVMFSRHLKDKKGGDIEEFPEDLRVREFPQREKAIV